MIAALSWLAFALLLLVQPLVPASWPLWGAHVTVIGAMLLLAAPAVARGGPVRWGVRAALLALMLLSLALALLFAGPDVPRAEPRWLGLSGALHIAFFLLACWWMPGPDAPPAARRRAGLWIAALLFAVCAEQLVLTMRALSLEGADGRLSGTLANPNAFGALLAATALLLLGMGFAERRAAAARGEPALRAARPQLLAALLAAPLLWGLLLTRSRGATAALLVTLLLLAVRWRKRRLLLCVLVGVVLLLVVPNPLRERLLALRTDHAFSRTFVWGAALDVAARHPLGLGPGLFKDSFLPLAWDPAHPWLLHQRAEVGLTHNFFLTMAVGWGWLACAALVALTTLALLRLARTQGTRDEPLRLGAALAATVLLLELQVDGIEQNPLIFSLFLLLVAAVLAGLPRERGLAVPGRVAAALLVVAGGSALALVAWRTHGHGRLVAAQALAAAWTPQADPAPVRAALVAATEAAPGDGGAPRETVLFDMRVLRALIDAGAKADDPRVRQAVESGQQAAAVAIGADGRDPDAARLGSDLSLLLWRRFKHRTLLDQYIERARAVLELDPLDVEGHFELAQEAQRAGLDELARQEFGEVFRLEPDHLFAWYLLARIRDAEGDREGALYAWQRASEALLNVRIKAQVDTPRSREFFEGLLKKVDQAEVLQRIAALRQELFS